MGMSALGSNIRSNCFKNRRLINHLQNIQRTNPENNFPDCFTKDKGSRKHSPLENLMMLPPSRQRKRTEEPQPDLKDICQLSGFQQRKPRHCKQVQKQCENKNPPSKNSMRYRKLTKILDSCFNWSRASKQNATRVWRIEPLDQYAMQNMKTS